MDAIARARPLLGTIVAIRAEGLPHACALDAIEAAFAEVVAVQRCMSFHDPHSDLSRLHRAGGAAMAVDARTHEVLRHALDFAAASDGLFDPTVAAQLVAWRHLPCPEDAPPPDAAANWRDIELLADGRVRLRRAAWLDLGGIAKGYAVDRTLALLRAAGFDSASVNAGGDLARFGTTRETVLLQVGDSAALDLGDAAIATSRATPRQGVHVHGRTRHAAGARRGVSVIATSCLAADALTKIVLADTRVGDRLLRRHGARAYLHDRRGWRAFGADA